MKIEFSQQFS